MFNLFKLLRPKTIPPYTLPKTWHLKYSHLTPSIIKKGRSFISMVSKPIAVGDYLIVDIIHPPVLCKIKNSVKITKNGEESYKIVFYKVPCKKCRICGKLFELFDISTKCPKCKVDD